MVLIAGIFTLFCPVDCGSILLVTGCFIYILGKVWNPRRKGFFLYKTAKFISVNEYFRNLPQIEETVCLILFLEVLAHVCIIGRYLVEPPLVVSTIRRAYYYSDNVQCHRWIIIMVMNLNVQVLIYYTFNKIYKTLAMSLLLGNSLTWVSFFI